MTERLRVTTRLAGKDLCRLEVFFPLLFRKAKNFVGLNQCKQMNLEESYRALGLKPGASMEEARRSYYRLVKFFHPDRHQASPGLLRKATEETKKLNLAYERVCKVLEVAGQSAPEKPKRDKPSRTEVPGDPPIHGQAFIIPSCGVKLNW